MTPPKLQAWLQKDFFPQRVLLSGGTETFEMAQKIAAQLQGVEASRLEIQADILILKDEGESFKIGNKDTPEKNSVRGLIQWVNQKPISPHRIIILENFERLSREAPHAILKVLEEPPEKALFLFTTRNHHQILDTILSRVTVVRMHQNMDDFAMDAEVEHFFESRDLIAKFRQIEVLTTESKKEKSRQKIFDFLDSLILHARFFHGYRPFLERVFQARERIEKNVNTRLVLEHLAIHCTQLTR